MSLVVVVVVSSVVIDEEGAIELDAVSVIDVAEASSW
jgi:hypothetical protein